MHCLFYNRKQDQRHFTIKIKWQNTRHPSTCKEMLNQISLVSNDFSQRRECAALSHFSIFKTRKRWKKRLCFDKEIRYVSMWSLMLSSAFFWRHLVFLLFSSHLISVKWITSSTTKRILLICYFWQWILQSIQKSPKWKLELAIWEPFRVRPY